MTMVMAHTGPLWLLLLTIFAILTILTMTITITIITTIIIVIFSFLRKYNPDNIRPSTFHIDLQVHGEGIPIFQVQFEWFLDIHGACASYEVELEQALSLSQC